jgi:hypothetical protein
LNFFHAAHLLFLSLSQRSSLFFSHGSEFAFSLSHHLTTKSVIPTFKQPKKDRLKVATDGKKFNLFQTNKHQIVVVGSIMMKER